MRTKTENGRMSFLEVYRRDISPKLMEVDLLVKTSEDKISVEETAAALDLTKEDVREIMRQNHLSHIDRHSIQTIMYHGSSDICALFRRELDCGTPYTYSVNNISYIYCIEPDIVGKAFHSLGITEATSFTLPEIFAAISVD